MNIIKSIKNLTAKEKALWLGSIFVIFISSVMLSDTDWLSVITSLIGATALIFVGKGDPLGQLITVIFALFYSLVSIKFRYWGEMITYLGMTAPSAVWALVTWLKNPYSEREVRVSKMTGKKWAGLILSAIAVTFLMYIILRFFNTPNLLVSTVSITTSFMASILTVMRSQYYAVFYAANDIVLIVLWTLASFSDISYIPMVLCFVIFLINDAYGFINWRSMRKKQKIKNS